jgi:Cu+-exporting ATPase
MNLLYSIEQYSSHPIAQSIVSALKDTALKIELKDVKETKGKGLSACDAAGNIYFIGHSRDLKESSEANLLLLKNAELMAEIFIEDELKKDAKETIDAFKAAGIKTILLSGDNRLNCENIGKKIGIDEIYSEQNPEQKLAIIHTLKANTLLAMVGDGVNDAPSLTKADVGISIGDGSGAAIESSQIVLLNTQRLSDVMTAMKISQATLKTIEQNLFWAFFYNVIAIPIAAIGLLNPMIAAIAMAFSDILVIGNSIRLKKDWERHVGNDSHIDTPHWCKPRMKRSKVHPRCYLGSMSKCGNRYR